MIHYKWTRYGFEYGAAEISRLHSESGKVWIGVKTPRQELQIYVTRTGKVRVFVPNAGELKAAA